MRREAVDRRAEEAADLGRLAARLLGAQIRLGLEAAAALGRMAAWEEIVRAQSELFRAGLAWWSRSSGESAAQPGQRRPSARRTGEHPVRAVMKGRRSVVAQPDETVQAAVARMAETEGGCGNVLVCNGDRLCGIVTGRDLMIRVVGRGLDPRRTRLAEVMTRDPERIESSETTREALRRMDGLAHHPLPVVEDGRALGVISLHDLPLETLAGMLPELEQRRALAERMR
jgi:CBS domain-containing protein